LITPVSILCFIIASCSSNLVLPLQCGILDSSYPMVMFCQNCKFSYSSVLVILTEFTSAKSSQYVEILSQRRTKTSRILEVTPWIQVVDVVLDGSNATVIRELAQSSEKWQGPMTMLMLSQLQWKWVWPAWWRHIWFHLQRLQVAVWPWWHYYT